MSNDKDFKVKNAIQPASYQESLGTIATGSVTVGYDLSVAAYDSKSFTFTSHDTAPRAVDFKSDGTKVYMVGATGDNVYQYSLSTAWDVSTASYDSVSFSISSYTTNPYGIAFKPDGTEMYVGDLGGDAVEQFTLSTAWNLSTASYTRTKSVSSADSVPVGVTFNNDGTKMYHSGQSNSRLYEWDLSTAWDISSATYSSVFISTSSNNSENNPFTMAFNGDGTKLFYWGSTTDLIYQYSLSTAFDLSTASYDSVTFDPASQTTTAYAIKFGDSGKKLYISGSTEDTVFQYSTGSATTTNTLDLSTGSVFEITPTSNIQVGLSNPAASGTVSQGTLLLDGAVNGYDLSGAAYDSVSFSFSSQDSGPRNVAFNTSGTKMYMVGIGSDNVYQYSLSTAFDLSTASYDSVTFSVSGQDTTPLDIAFNTGGTKMYITGNSSSSVHQYSLSTAFDLSTASYDSVSFSFSSQDSVVIASAFNNDGTKIYMLGTGTDSLYQYSLSTAFDVSTTSYDSVSFSVSSQGASPLGLAFNNAGTKFYVVEADNDSVYQYSLSTAFDLSTAAYDSVSFSVASQDTTPVGLEFNNDGSKMYMVGNVNSTIYQYTTGSAYTVTYDSAIQFGGGTAPDSPLANETDVLAFSTRDGGTSYQAMQAIDGAK